jgi:hypothetical protein
MGQNLLNPQHGTDDELYITKRAVNTKHIGKYQAVVAFSLAR